MKYKSIMLRADSGEGKGGKITNNGIRRLRQTRKTKKTILCNR